MSSNYPPEEYSSEWFFKELQKLREDIVGRDYYSLRKLTVEPSKLRDGLIVYADGTEWDPGSGEGIYAYYSATWNFLG